MGCKFLPDPLGIHIVNVFSDNGLTHVTKQAFVKNTIHKIIFLPEEFQAICISLGHKGGLKDFLTVMGSTSH